MKIFIKKLLSLILITTFVLSLFLVKVSPFTTASAKNDLNNLFGISSFLENDDDEEPKILYYFSDSTHCTTYRQNLLDSEIVDICYLYDWSDYDDMKQRIIEYMRVGGYDTIADAYIIFELSKGFQRETPAIGNVLFPEILQYLFSLWKQNGCNIMFICSTNESRLGPYKDFLNYVDLHVNISLFDTLITNAFDTISFYGYDNCLDDYTFILDYTLSNGITTNDYHCAWFFYNWLIPLVRKAYKQEILVGKSSRELYSDHNIKILCYLGNNVFYDVEACSTTTFSEDNAADFISYYITQKNVVALGTDWSGETLTEEWLDILYYIRGIANYNFPIYLCNSDGFDISSYDQTNLLATGAPQDIYSIMVDFLDDDISRYSNVSGQCIQTYIPLPSGPSGWMYYTPMTDEEISPWILFFLDTSSEDHEDYDYYYNYSSNW